MKKLIFLLIPIMFGCKSNKITQSVKNGVYYKIFTEIRSDTLNVRSDELQASFEYINGFNDSARMINDSILVYYHTDRFEVKKTGFHLTTSYRNNHWQVSGDSAYIDSIKCFEYKRIEAKTDSIDRSITEIELKAKREKDLLEYLNRKCEQ